MALFLVLTATAEEALLSVEPRHYVAHRSLTPLAIDGKLAEPSWQRAHWSDAFVEISDGAPPQLATRVKLLWDDVYLYVAADIEEPHVWADITERDSKIYHDNDFEVLIDPDGDTHEYFELEINAYGTVWDLFLPKPYRDGGAIVGSWDIAGLTTAVHVWGTINNPKDIDRGWSLEIALPWTVLKECAHRPAPPRDGDQWRLNFARVQWPVSPDEDNQGYVKPEGSRDERWVWSRQGVADMHYPEQWGFVQFSSVPVGKQTVDYAEEPERQAMRLLREIYYRQTAQRRVSSEYSANLDTLGVRHRILRNFLWPPRVQVTEHTFEAWVEEVEDLHGDGHISRWAIRQDSKTWKIQPPEAE